MEDDPTSFTEITKKRSIDFDKCLLVLMIRDYVNPDNVWDS